MISQTIGKYYGVDENGDHLFERGNSEQGYVFKSYENYYSDLNKVCYIPELTDTAYTHQDFLDICNEQEEIAENIFLSVDWQHPETYYQDMFNHGELAYCEDCDKVFWCYGKKCCDHCGSKNFSSDC